MSKLHIHLHRPTKDTSFSKGAEVFTSHRNTVFKGVFQGIDPDSSQHYLVKVGNSLQSIPKSQVHQTKPEAQKMV